MTTNENGLTFKRWYALANRYCLRIAGVGIEDLPDGNSNDAWMSNATPRDYAEMMLAEEGFPSEGFPEDSPYYAPAPAPRPSFGRGAEYYVEEITLENGDTLRLERRHSASGYVRVL